jgi:hypothetical protein
MPRIALLSLLLVSLSSLASGKDNQGPLVGRWDIVVHEQGFDFPSWLEIVPSGRDLYVGRFVAAFGSARPISQIMVNGAEFSFEIPAQWEQLNTAQWMKGKIDGDKIRGTTLAYTGNTVSFDGVRAPAPKYNAHPKWGKPIALFDSKTLKGWTTIPKDKKSQWTVRNGLLSNIASGANLVSERKFKDFKIEVEFRYPEDSNSGIYLRGRYEVQIESDKVKPPKHEMTGGIYGFFPPKVDASKMPGEWQRYEITLVDRFVTVNLNGVTVISEQEIPGITGGALDSNEAEPGPVLIQGDHGPIEFRKFVVTPAI